MIKTNSGLQNRRIKRLTTLCGDYYFRSKPKGTVNTFLAKFDVEASKSIEDYEIQIANRETKILYNATWIDSFVDGRNSVFKPTGAIDRMIKRIGETDKGKKDGRGRKKSNKSI